MSEIEGISLTTDPESLTPKQIAMLCEVNNILRGIIIYMLKVANRMTNKPENNPVIFGIDPEMHRYTMTLEEVYNTTTDQAGIEIMIEKIGASH